MSQLNSGQSPKEVKAPERLTAHAQWEGMHGIESSREGNRNKLRPPSGFFGEIRNLSRFLGSEAVLTRALIVTKLGLFDLARTLVGIRHSVKNSTAVGQKNSGVCRRGKFGAGLDKDVHGVDDVAART
ncbi:hypothetical protein RCH12_003753 [Cryobacterium sp. MP_3.1]|nr:hypothetical protein [Cryobacterium sp. MP_3.1]